MSPPAPESEGDRRRNRVRAAWDADWRSVRPVALGVVLGIDVDLPFFIGDCLDHHEENRGFSIGRPIDSTPILWAVNIVFDPLDLRAGLSLGIEALRERDGATDQNIVKHLDLFVEHV